MIETVVKLGGAALGMPIQLPSDWHPLIVPGGGPFADTVRAIDDRWRLGDDAAHWGAILAMDQFAYALGTQIRGSRLITSPDEIMAGDVPILAPYRWLREKDPLPHSWDVTSDSIAAWVAHAVGARRLLLVKPVERAPELVDPYFDCVRGALDVRVLAAANLAEPPAWQHLSCL